MLYTKDHILFNRLARQRLEFIFSFQPVLLPFMPTRFRFHQLLLCLVVFCATTGRGQQYNFINYSTESGLAQSQVRAIAQDRKGFLWLGTLDGLTRYDGKKFVNYSIQSGLIDNQVISLLPDKKEGLWIGTMGGLNFYNGQSFHAYPFRQEMAETRVNAMTFDQEGNLWLATDGAGVCRFDGELFTYFSEENGLPHNVVRATCTDASGRVWFGTRNGICYYDGHDFRRLDTAMAQPYNVSHIFADQRGQLWFGTFGEGVYHFNGKIFRNYTTADGLINDWIRSGIQDSEGNYWFASKFGISRFDGKNFTRFTEAEGMPLENTNVVFEDRERNIWIGSDGKGLCRFLGETFTNLTSSDGLSSNIVMSVVEDRDKRLWFSTFDKGITCRSDGKTTYYTTDQGLTDNSIWASLRDRNNQLWFCTSDGISRFDGKRFTNYNVADGLSAHLVYSVCQDRSGNLWFGTSQGVSRFDGKKFHSYLNDYLGKDIARIVEDKSGRIWLASKSGLYKYENGEFSRYTTAEGLAHNTVFSLAVDQNNCLWIGSKAGINYYDGKTFSKFLIGDASISNNISFLIHDGKSSLWIGTNSGVFRLDAAEYARSRKVRFRHYTVFDGLPGMECNQNAVYRDESGDIWMGTTDGVIRYDPHIRDFHSSNTQPITHISGVRLFLKDTNWTKVTDRIDPVTHLPIDLQVGYQTRHFTFDYLGIKLSNPANVRYKYQLEGFDEGWSASTDANFATYSNLSSGKYTFKVVAGDLAGNWNKTPATFSFEILPPWWTRWWFIVLCCATGLFLLWAIYRVRVDQIRKKHHAQQLEYKSRLLALEHQSLNSSMNRHFIFNALNSIQYYMNKEDKLSAHRYLSRFAKLIRMNLDSSMSNVVPVSEEINRLDLYLQIESMRFEDKFDYKIEIADEVDADSIEIPPMLLQPYVENSILHGILPSDRKGLIQIRVEQRDDESVVFSVEDNGIGIDDSLRRKESQNNLHVSRGTAITAQRIQLLGAMNDINISINGPFEIRDAENRITGTRVELIIH